VTWHHPNYYRKLREERKKIPVSGTKERETAPSRIKTALFNDLIDYKKFHQMMVTQLKAPSHKHQAASALKKTQ